MNNKILAGIIVLAATLSGCAGIGTGDEPISSTSENIPLKQTMDIRAERTEWIVFDAPRDDVLRFDYELLAGSNLEVCLMTTPNRVLFEKGQDVPCGHSPRLYPGGYSARYDAAYSEEFDGGEYNLALSCGGGNDCAVHVRIRHDDDEYVSSGTPVKDPDATYALGSRLTADLDPERDVLYKFQILEAERLTFKIQDVRGNPMRVCFVDGDESTRLAQGKPVKCLAESRLDGGDTWEAYVDLIPDEYGLFIDCLSTALAGCSYKLELHTPTNELEAIDITGNTSPNGYAAISLPHRETFTIQGQRSEHLVFGVPAGQRLHYEAEQTPFPSNGGFDMTACLAFEADLARLESGKPVGCVDSPRLINTGYSKVTSWQKYRDLDQDWYAVHFDCRSQDPCHFSIDLRLEDNYYRDLRPAANGKSPDGHAALTTSKTITDDMQPERRRSYVFQVSDDGRLSIDAEWIAGAASMGICLTYEDQVKQYMDGESVSCIDQWTLRATGYSKIKQVSDYNDLPADWYAILLSTGAQSEDFSYKLTWGLS